MLRAASVQRVQKAQSQSTNPPTAKALLGFTLCSVRQQLSAFGTEDRVRRKMGWKNYYKVKAGKVFLSCKKRKQKNNKIKDFQ